MVVKSLDSHYLLQPGQTLQSALADVTKAILEQLSEHYPEGSSAGVQGTTPLDEPVEDLDPDALQEAFTSLLESLHSDAAQAVLAESNIQIASLARASSRWVCDLEQVVENGEENLKLSEDSSKMMRSRLEGVDEKTSKTIAHVQELAVSMLQLLRGAGMERDRLKKRLDDSKHLIIGDAERQVLQEKREEAQALGTKLLEMGTREGSDVSSAAVIKDLEAAIAQQDGQVVKLKQELELVTRRAKIMDQVRGILEGGGNLNRADEHILEVIEELKAEIRTKVVLPMLHQHDAADVSDPETSLVSAQCESLMMQRDELRNELVKYDEMLAAFENKPPIEDEIRQRLEICSPALRRTIQVADVPMLEEGSDGSSLMHARLHETLRVTKAECAPLLKKLDQYETLLRNARRSLGTLADYRHRFVRHIRGLRENYINDALARDTLPNETSPWVLAEVGPLVENLEEKRRQLNEIWSIEENKLCGGTEELDERKAFTEDLIESCLGGLTKLREFANAELCEVKGKGPTDGGAVDCVKMFKDESENVLIEAALHQRELNESILQARLNSIQVRREAAKKEAAKKEAAKKEAAKAEAAKAEGGNDEVADGDGGKSGEAHCPPGEEPEGSDAEINDRGPTVEDAPAEGHTVKRRISQKAQNLHGTLAAARMTRGVFKKKAPRATVRIEAADICGESSTKNLSASHGAEKPDVGISKLRKRSETKAPSADDSEEKDGPTRKARVADSMADEEGGDRDPSPASTPRARRMRTKSAHLEGGGNVRLSVKLSNSPPKTQKPRGVRKSVLFSTNMPVFDGVELDSAVAAASEAPAPEPDVPKKSAVDDISSATGSSADEDAGGTMHEALSTDDGGRDAIGNLLDRLLQPGSTKADCEEDVEPDENSAIAQLKSLHATTRRLAKESADAGAKVQSLASMIGGLPLDADRCRLLPGEDAEKNQIAECMQELVEDRLQWWRDRQRIDGLEEALERPHLETVAFHDAYNRLRDLIDQVQPPEAGEESVLKKSSPSSDEPSSAAARISNPWAERCALINP